MMPDEDPTLDAVLSALGGVEPKNLEDDDRWAKRVASRVSTFAPMSRRELDPILDAPFPDDHQDFDHATRGADDHDQAHADHAAAAADFGDARGWEGSMSDDASSSPPPNSLAGLSGLTRSGPASSSAEPIDGAAKGEDSGLIDLRAMSQPEPETAAAAAAEVPASAAAPPSLGKAPAAPSPVSAANVAVVAAPAANAVPPSSTTATAASAAAATPRKEEKKGGAVIWLALGGLAAAAAAAFFVVGPMAKKDEAPSAAAPPAAQTEAKKPEAEKVAAADKAAPTTMPEPAASAAPTPTEDPQVAIAAKPGTAPVAGGTGKAALAPDPKATTTATTKSSATTAPTETPKSAGTGSLDEVLGIGKDQPAAKATATDNLPDKPDTMDVRSAINGKVSAATACVKGLDAPSNVAVTFGPGGAVSGVVVTSGPAKGTGAESCIKNAFSPAKVPPSKKGATGSASLVP
jgi:hypothetical protein